MNITMKTQNTNTSIFQHIERIIHHDHVGFIHTLMQECFTIRKAFDTIELKLERYFFNEIKTSKFLFWLSFFWF